MTLSTPDIEKPSPVSVPEGDARALLVRQIVNGVSEALTKRRAVEADQIVTAALLSAESRGRPQWQPIEKFNGDETDDGARMLLCVRGYVFEAYWSAEREAFFEAGSHWTDATDGQVRDATHFMPLPSPPSSPEEG